MDAAIATALALAVVYPQAGNLAGGGFLVAQEPDGTVQALDFRETAPARASRDMFLGPGRQARTEGVHRLGARRRDSPAPCGATPKRTAASGRCPGRRSWPRPSASRGRDSSSRPGSPRTFAEIAELLTRWEETRRLFFPAGEPLARRGAPPPARARRDARADREGGAGGVPPGRDGRAPRLVREGLTAASSRRRTWPATHPSGGPRTRSASAASSSTRCRFLRRRGRSSGRSSPSSRSAEAPRRPASTRTRTTCSSRRSGARTRIATAGSATADCIAVPLARSSRRRVSPTLGASIDPARATPSASVGASLAGARRRRRRPTCRSRRPTALRSPSRRR